MKIEVPVIFKRIVVGWYCIALILWFSGCQKEELPVPQHNAGEVVTSSVEMGADYRYQIFYDLKTNTIIAQNLKTDWDLGFETSKTGYRIILNTSKAMFARNTGITDFESVSDTLGFEFNKNWDNPNGNLDSTAIGNWKEKNEVYILDRGYSHTGLHQGFRKIQFLSVNETGYTFRFANLNGSNETQFQVEKDSLYNFTFLSLSNGGQIVEVEPPKENWDLCFTQYLHIFYDPFTPYLVTGCLLNRTQTYATQDSVRLFSEITYQDIANIALSSDINTIGYEWKTFVNDTYSTNPNLNYIIKNKEGFYFKLHFIDFYNTSGLKGTPKWEVQEL
ncbi:MAG: HmuY family protein [Sphingobacteriales bacterium]|nr:MAG: HmuY family protein [Sphingobacteriales bacterium]